MRSFELNISFLTFIGITKIKSNNEKNYKYLFFAFQLS
jgi:hypothetical protein